VKRRKRAEVAAPAAAHVDAHVRRLVQQVPGVGLHLQPRRPQGGRHAIIGALQRTAAQFRTLAVGASRMAVDGSD